MPKKRRFNSTSRRSSIGRNFKYQWNQSPPEATQISARIQKELVTETEVLKTIIKASPAKTNEVPISIDDDKLDPEQMSPAGIVSNTGLRLAIAYIFIECHDLPPEEEWHGRNGTIAKILRTLNMTVNQRKLIRSVLQNVTACYKKGIEYTGVNKIEQVRDTKKIQENSIDEELIATWMEDGLGFRLTTMFVNEHRQQEDREEVSVKSIFNAFCQMNPLITRIDKKPQQPENHQIWAEARYNWVTQLLIRTNSIAMDNLPEELKRERYFDRELLEREGKMFEKM